MRRSKPEKIGSLWSEFVEKNPVIERRLCEAKIPEIWAKIVGPGVASLTSSLNIKNGVLYVSMSSSVARHEVFMVRTQLKNSINHELGMAVVNNIIVK